jgi:hypothetical protein
MGFGIRSTRMLQCSETGVAKGRSMVNLTQSPEQKANGEKARGQIEGMEQRH